MSKANAVMLHLKTLQLQSELHQLSPDTLHYVRHGIASESELALVARICEHSDSLLNLLAQVGDESQ